MDGKLIKKLVPESLLEIYEQVYTSIEEVEDERVKVALASVLVAIHKDSCERESRNKASTNVVSLARSTAR